MEAPYKKRGVKIMKILVKHNDRVTVGFTCPFCRKGSTLEISTRQYREYFMQGSLVQNVFPELEPTYRELIVSEICPKCQEKIFG